MPQAGRAWPAKPRWAARDLPHLLQIAFYEMQYSTNQAWAMYPGLTIGAAECFLLHGTDEQKDLYLPKLIVGPRGPARCA